MLCSESASSQRTWRLLAWLLSASLLSIGACSGRERAPEGYYEIQEGWTKDRVVEALGEPSQVFEMPFEAPLQEDCADLAESKLVFSYPEGLSLFVFLDSQDRVACKQRRRQLMRH